MKNRNLIGKILLFFGSVPFLIALGFCFVSSLLDGGGGMFPKTSFLEYLFMFSFLYWPTYVIGIGLIALSLRFRSKSS